MKPPSTNELLDALHAAAAKPLGRSDCFTVTEIREHIGWSHNRIRTELLKLKNQGRVEVIPIHRMRLDNVIQPSHAYRFLAKRNSRKRR